MPPVIPEQFNDYVVGWQEMIREERQKMRQDAQVALFTAKNLAMYLSTIPTVTRVWLFGSLAWYLRGQKNYLPQSDLDLAVEGLSPSDYFPVLSSLNNLSDRPVDLIDINHCPSSLKGVILEKGILLYERQGPTANLGGGN
ncbi:MAG: uncharacterized protein PWP65_791 [Clostridia bacterium]|nr:uncharacterized protein [Clostridia bacterium]